MASKVFKIGIVVIMVLNGIFFASNIYVLGDRGAAVAMHGDLAPTASAVMANAKVIITFVTGLLYLLSAYAIVRKKREWAVAGVLACFLFNGLYAVEIMKWGSSHPFVWFGFCLMGGLSFLIGAYSYLVLRRSVAL